MSQYIYLHADDIRIIYLNLTGDKTSIQLSSVGLDGRTLPLPFTGLTLEHEFFNFIGSINELTVANPQLEESSHACLQHWA